MLYLQKTAHRHQNHHDVRSSIGHWSRNDWIARNEPRVGFSKSWAQWVADDPEWDGRIMVSPKSSTRLPRATSTPFQQIWHRLYVVLLFTLPLFLFAAWRFRGGASAGCEQKARAPLRRHQSLQEDRDKDRPTEKQVKFAELVDAALE